MRKAKCEAFTRDLTAEATEAAEWEDMGRRLQQADHTFQGKGWMWLQSICREGGEERGKKLVRQDKRSLANSSKVGSSGSDQTKQLDRLHGPVLL